MRLNGKALSIIAVVSFAGLSASSAMAQLNPGAAAAFGEFLSQHTDQAAMLRRNPNLLGDHRYVVSHPDLRQYLQQHPELTRTMRDGGPGVTSNLPAASEMMYRDPGLTRDVWRDPNLLNDPNFLARHPRFAGFIRTHPETVPYLTGGWNGWRHPGMPAADNDDPRNFSRWLYDHPEMREQLAENPRMAAAPEFLQDHPEWSDYLNQHPGLRDRFQDRDWDYANWYQRHRWEDRDDWYGRRGDWWRDREEAAEDQDGDYDARPRDYDEEDYGHEHHRSHGHHYGWDKHWGHGNGHGHGHGHGHDND